MEEDHTNLVKSEKSSVRDSSVRSLQASSRQGQRLKSALKTLVKKGKAKKEVAVKTLDQVKAETKLKDSCITPAPLWRYSDDKTESTGDMNWDTCSLKPDWKPTEDFCFLQNHYPGVLNRANGPWSMGRAAGPKAVLELLRGSSTIMLTPHSSAFNIFGRTILKCLGYPLRIGPVSYPPHVEINPTQGAMTLVLTPQYLQYIQNLSHRKSDERKKPVCMQVKTREWAVQEDIMQNLLDQGCGHREARLLANC